MRRFFLILGGLILLAALVYHCIQTRPPVIQENVLACVSGRLYAADSADLVIAVDGRDVTLSGSIPDEAARQHAALAAIDGCGARVVSNQLQIRVPDPYITSMCIDGDGGHISGSVGSANVRATVMQRADRQFHGDAEVDLEVRGDAPDGHSKLVAEALGELTQLEDACITIEDDVLTASGRIRSEAARDRFVTLVDQTAEGEFRTRYELVVPSLSSMAKECEDYYAEHFDPGENVLFDFDSAELNSSGRDLLDSLLAEKQHCANLNIIVAGHTDDIGDPIYNRDLSLQRANAVIAYLVGKGVNAEQLIAVGYGETQPRADNDTDEGRTKNRRIEFRVQEET
jgi:outer membrane protein OmpA-like peptidoglycan-associated protein